MASLISRSNVMIKKLLPFFTLFIIIQTISFAQIDWTANKKAIEFQ